LIFIGSVFNKCKTLLPVKSPIRREYLVKVGTFSKIHPVLHLLLEYLTENYLH